jgi:hypothetical protein
VLVVGVVSAVVGVEGGCEQGAVDDESGEARGLVGVVAAFFEGDFERFVDVFAEGLLDEAGAGRSLEAAEVASELEEVDAGGSGEREGHMGEPFGFADVAGGVADGLSTGLQFFERPVDVDAFFVAEVVVEGGGFEAAFFEEMGDADPFISAGAEKFAGSGGESCSTVSASLGDLAEIVHIYTTMITLRSFACGPRIWVFLS